MEKLLQDRQSQTRLRQAIEKYSVSDPIRTRELLLKYCCDHYVDPRGDTGYLEQGFISRKLYTMGNLTREQTAKVLSALVGTEYLENTMEYSEDLAHAPVIEKALLENPRFFEKVSAAVSKGPLTAEITPDLQKFAGPAIRKAMTSNPAGTEIASGVRLLQAVSMYDAEVQNHLADLALGSKDPAARYRAAAAILLQEIPGNPTALAKLAKVTDKKVWEDLMRYQAGNKEGQLKKWLEAVDRYPELKTEFLDRRIADLVSYTAGPDDMPLPAISRQGLEYLRDRGPKGVSAVKDLFEDERILIEVTTDWDRFFEENPGKFNLLRESLPMDAYLQATLRQNSLDQIVNMHRLKMRTQVSKRSYLLGDAQKATTEAFESFASSLATLTATQKEGINPKALGTWVDIGLDLDVFSGDSKQKIEKGLVRTLVNTRYPDEVETGHAMRALRELAKHNPLIPSSFTAITNRLKRIRDWRTRASDRILEDAIGILESQSSSSLPKEAQALLAQTFQIQADEVIRESRGRTMIRGLQSAGFNVRADSSPLPPDEKLGRLYKVLKGQPDFDPNLLESLRPLFEAPAVASDLARQNPEFAVELKKRLAPPVVELAQVTKPVPVATVQVTPVAPANESPTVSASASTATAGEAPVTKLASVPGAFSKCSKWFGDLKIKLKSKLGRSD
ncbi:MAG: hypothetical protein U1E10_14045 [Bdellovibrionales bacterium]|nr:hypothetical protein [Bdellovibrionales bacterium]